MCANHSGWNSAHYWYNRNVHTLFFGDLQSTCFLQKWKRATFLFLLSISSPVLHNIHLFLRMVTNFFKRQTDKSRTCLLDSDSEDDVTADGIFSLLSFDPGQLLCQERRRDFRDEGVPNGSVLMWIQRLNPLASDSDQLLRRSPWPAIMACIRPAVCTWQI